MWTLQVTVSGVLYLLALKGQESTASCADDRESHPAQTIEHPVQMTENRTRLTHLRGTELVYGKTLMCHIV